MIKQKNLTEEKDDLKEADGEAGTTLGDAIDAAKKLLDDPEVYSGDGDIEKALDETLEANRLEIENGDRNFQNLLLTGAAGSGKSARVKAWAKKNKINLVKVIGSSMDDTDIGGVPYADVKAGRAIKLTTAQLDSLENIKDSVLFLDEWNRAPKTVRATLLNLIQEHEIPDSSKPTGMRYLPNFLFTVAAVNPSDDLSYDTDRLDDAEMGRVRDLQVRNDPQIWFRNAEFELNRKIKNMEAKGNAAAVKRFKGQLAIITKLINDNRFSFDSKADIAKSKDAFEKGAGNGKILTGRNLTNLYTSCNGTKEDFLNKWDGFCNSEKKKTAEEILKNYVDVDDKANDALKGGTQSNVFSSASSRLDSLRAKLKQGMGN